MHANQQLTVHGVLLNVNGCGVMLRGPSGCGKSDLALNLIERGQQLIADDAITFKKLDDDTIVGYCSPLLAGYLEVYGLGIINIREQFGDHAICSQQALDLVIDIVDSLPPMDNYPLSQQRQDFSILGSTIPLYPLPLLCYQNPSLMVEMTVANHLSNSQPYKEFIDKQQSVTRETS